MAYKVVNPFRDKENKKKLYKRGGVFESKDSKRLSFLEKEGFIKETSELNHVGGGYYELPNGEKVKGKDQAISALKDAETRGE